MTGPLLSLTIGSERDVVTVRQRARQIATLLGFDGQDQTRIATAVSEIARNAHTYGGGGTASFAIEGVTKPQLLTIRIGDRGPGIADVERILDGRYQSATGMGIGITGARRLMDRFLLDSAPGRGTIVTLTKLLPRRVPLLTPQALSRIGEELLRHPPDDPFGEIQRQNRDLLRSLDELARRQEELTVLNQELEDTNRGVVALYAELDEKADHLRRADEIKSRFLSNMSHEFRTPVNSILALARMLLDRTDGDLNPEQELQLTYIRKAAESLAELVNDLLDLAKVEAGKTVVTPTTFAIPQLFGALRGMLRPLLLNDTVALVFDDGEALPPMQTDEAKVSQILRNFVSNALKFTEHGEVRVRAQPVADATAVAFSVTDTGIGIAPEDQERIFEEFSQIDSPVQRRVRGTGLGLPLCRKLAALVGGTVSVESRLGAGSTFTATIPVVYRATNRLAHEIETLDPELPAILVVEDSDELVHLYRRHLDGAGFQVVAVHTVGDAREALLHLRPRAILLDILLGGEDAWELLADLKRRPDTMEIPVVVISTVPDAAKGLALGADAYFVKPVDRHQLLQKLTTLITPERMVRILVIDDEEISRYVLTQHLAAAHHVVTEAAGGRHGLELARRDPPDVICLDLAMPDLDGFAVLAELAADPTTRDIPVVVVSSQPLDDAERAALLERASIFLSKNDLSTEQVQTAVAHARRLAAKDERP